MGRVNGEFQPESYAAADGGSDSSLDSRVFLTRPNFRAYFAYVHGIIEKPGSKIGAYARKTKKFLV